jgi:hypothetical protein
MFLFLTFYSIFRLLLFVISSPRACKNIPNAPYVFHPLLEFALVLFFLPFLPPFLIFVSFSSDQFPAAVDGLTEAATILKADFYLTGQNFRSGSAAYGVH